MTMKEMDERALEIIKEDHTNEEWRHLFGEFVEEVSDFYILESFLEDAIYVKYGQEALSDICRTATQEFQDYKEGFENPNKQLSETDQHILDELFGID